MNLLLMPLTIVSFAYSVDNTTDSIKAWEAMERTVCMDFNTNSNYCDTFDVYEHAKKDTIHYKTDAGIKYYAIIGNHRYKYKLLSSNISFTNVIFFMRMSCRINDLEIQSEDSIRILNNERALCCAYIIAYDTKNNTTYRLRGFKENDFHKFRHYLRHCHINVKKLEIENLDVKCLIKCGGKKYNDTKCPCLMSCVERDNEPWNILPLRLGSRPHEPTERNKKQRKNGSEHF